MMSTYNRPCKPFTTCIRHVYDQQARLLPLDQELRSQFLQDLRVCINNIRFKGDLLFIGMDLND